jgi:RNA polymerase sigma-70 factor (ECF subfamily)
MINAISPVTLSENEPSVSLGALDDENVVERDLIERIRNGEKNLFYDLIRPHERSIFYAAVSILGNDADAEDAVQEAVLKAFKNLASFRHESKFRTWLTQIVINEAKMKLRKERRHLYESIEQGHQSDDGDYVPTDFTDWREIPLRALEQKELRAMLNDGLKSLHEKYRSVLVLRDVQQLSIAETAQVLGLTEENVKTRTSRARLQMRDFLARSWRGRQASADRNTVR